MSPLLGYLIFLFGFSAFVFLYIIVGAVIGAVDILMKKKIQRRKLYSKKSQVNSPENQAWAPEIQRYDGGTRR